MLVAGLRALSNEVCKNLALAGIGSITILDHEIVTEEDLGAQFFLSDSDIGKNVGSIMICFFFYLLTDTYIYLS